MFDSRNLDFIYPRVGVGLCIIKDERYWREECLVLLGQRKSKHGKDMWGFPGGHLEKWEDFESCALRELEEECGKIEVNLPRLWCVENTKFKDEDKHYVVVFMKCDWLSGEPQNMEPDKCERWEWFNWDNLPKPLMPGIKQIKQRGGLLW